ncbi:MAG TPA: hypothetical protein VLE91_02970 [Candidatus Saccharimonadales bacterium]|nr:hypothetical protein [Candidatus Saccharimonadales bacterium]
MQERPDIREIIGDSLKTYIDSIASLDMVSEVIVADYPNSDLILHNVLKTEQNKESDKYRKLHRYGVELQTYLSGGPFDPWITDIKPSELEHFLESMSEHNIQIARYPIPQSA